jgi:hypothetical protein
MEELMWDITRTSRRPLLQMDFDASSCYDRIIPSIASLASRSYGQHRHLCFIHSQFLRNAQFLLKTKLGLSTELYSHCTEYPIYGTGQGSTGSPTIWGLISTKLIETQEADASRAVFTIPDKSQSVRILSVNYFMTDESDHVYCSHVYSPIAHIYCVFAHAHAHHPVAMSLNNLTIGTTTHLHVYSSRRIISIIP